MMPGFHVLGLGDPLRGNSFRMMQNLVTDFVFVETINESFRYFHKQPPMQIITFQGDLYSPDPAQDSDGGGRTRKCAVRNASMIGHRREDCGTRVRDSCARASLPTLPLPGCWPRRGAGQRDLLLRPLRAQRRKDGPQRSCLTDARARNDDGLASVILQSARSYFRCQGCVTFWIRGLQVSLTKTKDKVFWSGRLNL